MSYFAAYSLCVACFCVGFAFAAILGTARKGGICADCNGAGGIETAPNDWHDCNTCEGSGKVVACE